LFACQKCLYGLLKKKCKKRSFWKSEVRKLGDGGFWVGANSSTAEKKEATGRSRKKRPHAHIKKVLGEKKIYKKTKIEIEKKCLLVTHVVFLFLFVT
jgi:hypothetical protein